MPKPSQPGPAEADRSCRPADDYRGRHRRHETDFSRRPPTTLFRMPWRPLLRRFQALLPAAMPAHTPLDQLATTGTWRGMAGLGGLAALSLALLSTGPVDPPPVNPPAAAADTTDHSVASRSGTRTQPGEEPPGNEAAPAETPEPVAGLDEEQMDNAVTIVEIGEERGISERGQAVALVTAMQEAQMRNVASDAVPQSLKYPHQGVMVDYDSVGIFQQRPSMGWGSVKECMDVEYATNTFYASLDDVDHWQDMELTEAAQQVQGSAFPDAYAQWEDMAWAVLEEVHH
jgi:hypothetical protein